MIKASFDAWMNAEYWVGGPKGVDFSSRYSEGQLSLMRHAFDTGKLYPPEDLLFISDFTEDTQYLIKWSIEMGALFTKRLQDAEQANS